MPVTTYLLCTEPVMFLMLLYFSKIFAFSVYMGDKLNESYYFLEKI